MKHKFKDGFETNIYKWEAKETKQIMQIVHGSAEHASRYDHFAKWLNEHGITVWAIDLRGHGENEKNKNNLGYFGKKGYEKVLKDVHEIGNLMKEKHPNIKYTLFGHSMGSFIVRAYSLIYGDIDKLIAMGTNHFPKAISQIQYIYSLFVSAIFPKKHKAKMLDKISYKKFDKQVKAKSEKEWLSYDKKNVETFIKDELCGFVFTPNGFSTMIKWIIMMNNKKKIKKLNPDMQNLFIAGKDDPVGNFGKGPNNVYKIYKKYGKQAEIILMEKSRHEILNEKNKEEVYKNILNFINKK